MNHFQNFKNDFIEYNNRWKIVKNLFDKKSENKSNINIPKKIHQIWLGSKLPEKYKNLQQTWIKLHPEWQYKLWTDKDIDTLKIININLYKLATNYGEKSDILRYEILYKFGGLYVDTDFECLKSFDVLINNHTFFAGINYGPEPIVLTGLIACTAKHPILEACVKNLKESNKTNNVFFDVLKRTSIFYFTECFFNNLNQTSILFPMDYFYPVPEINKNSKNIKKYLKPNSFAIHYWHTSWLNK